MNLNLKQPPEPEGFVISILVEIWLSRLLLGTKDEQTNPSITKVIIFWLENGKFEFSRKQYIFFKTQ